MVVLQHYYTSFVNKATGSAGFQVKAMSPDIPPDTQTAISRMISYRIPATSDAYATVTHPVALRYAYRGAQECIFLCSQSNGSDENGRPGNFFAHTLVMEPAIFTSIPPIFYWRSPFWKTRDSEDHFSLESLAEFDIEPTLDIENVWEFLAKGDRRKQFYKLMCAVVHLEKTQRRIVIIDTADQVALWVAAVSCVLPPDYRPLLTFATYHHDPYQTQFMITGTTSDSSFHASAEEYLSYFILNAETGITSEVEDSPYAELVAAATTADLYEMRLLPFFADYAQRFPLPTRIDEQLDLMALYSKMLTQSYSTTLTREAITAIDRALTTFEHLRVYVQDDLNELHRLGRILLNAYTSQQDLTTEIYMAYERVRTLLQDKKMPTDEFILDELKHFTGKIVTGEEPEQAVQSIAKLHQAYGDELFLAAMRRSEYLQWLTQVLERVQVRQMLHLWRYMGQYFQPDSTGQAVLLKSLQMVSVLLEMRRDDEEQNLLGAMGEAMAGQERAWLLLAVQHSVDRLNEALKHFYYHLVQPLSLEQRGPYRKIIQATHGDLLIYEVMSDIASAVAAGDAQRGLLMLERWMSYIRDDEGQRALLLTKGLAQLQRSCSASQWSALLPRILSSKALAPLPQKTEIQLVQAMLASISFSQYSPAYLDLYRKYQDYPVATDEAKTILAGMLAMSNGQVPASLVEPLYQRMKTLSSPMYQEEVKCFMAEFFRQSVTAESHKQMVSAILVWSYHQHFWAVYQRVLEKMITTPGQAKQAVVLVSMWFTAHPHEFRLPYLPQKFFLWLPGVLDELCRDRVAQDGLREFMALGSKQRWYSAIQEYLSGPGNLLTTMGQAVGQTMKAQLQKLWSGQNVDQQKLEQERLAFEATISRLFDKKGALTSHEHDLPQIYTSERKALFWDYYWKQFIHSLLTQSPEHTLDLLSFWFDNSFDSFGTTPYVAQEFFLGLPDALEATRKERGYKEMSYRIDEKARKLWKERYMWYGLVNEFFVTRGKK